MENPTKKDEQEIDKMVTNNSLEERLRRESGLDLNPKYLIQLHEPNAVVQVQVLNIMNQDKEYIYQALDKIYSIISNLAEGFVDNPRNVIEVESHDRRIIILNSAKENNDYSSVSEEKVKDESGDKRETSETTYLDSSNSKVELIDPRPEDGEFSNPDINVDIIYNDEDLIRIKHPQRI